MTGWVRAVASCGLVIITLPCCAISSTYISSSPLESNAVKTYKQKRSDLLIHDLGDLQFTVAPFNARFKSGLFWLTLIPIPMNSAAWKEAAVRFDKNSTAAEPPFIVEMGIRATRGYVLFDTSMVRLEANGQQTAPDAIVQLLESQCAKFGYRFLLTSCRLESVPIAAPAGTVRIEKDTVKYVWLLFEQRPPTPDRSFSMRLEGLGVEGSVIPSISVSFGAKEVSHSDSAP